MTTYKGMLAVVAALWLGFAGPASASLSVASVDLTPVDASGLPGSIVYPTISLDITGFDFDSFTLELVYPTALTLLPSESRVRFAAASFTFDKPLTELPGYFASHIQQGGNWHDSYLSLSPIGLTVTGSLLLTGAFEISNTAAAGSYPILVTGFVSTGPVVEEPEFNGVVNVTAVPEPETWLLWISGIGLLVTRAARRRNRKT